jgi:hypothetical protein
MTIFERVIALYDLEYFIKMGGGGETSQKQPLSPF